MPEREVLCPSLRHENGTPVNYLSWQKRGWCQVLPLHVRQLRTDASCRSHSWESLKHTIGRAREDSDSNSFLFRKPYSAWMSGSW